MTDPLFIDLECYSRAPLEKTGAYRYAADDSFELLLFSYAWGRQSVQTIDLASGEEIPENIIRALHDPGVTKWAFNAAFERICLSNYLGAWLDPEGWQCHMVWAATLGLPLSLDGVAKALKLDRQKLTTGKALIRLFCRPDAHTGKRHYPGEQPEKWQQFVTYNQRDVEAEQDLHARLSKLPPREELWADYWLDQRINDRGVQVDTGLARAAITLDEQLKTRLTRQAKAITGLENPNSVQQLLTWLQDQGAPLASLTKAAVAEAIPATTGQVRQALEIRQQLAKSSTKKYQAMLHAASPRDHRARGLMQFHGAPRTGRWAGRLIQVQNLPRNTMPTLHAARTLTKNQDLPTLQALYDTIPDVLSQLIRTAFTPAEGHRFIVADYSAIEARVIAWLAGERWVLDAFRNGHDIYCETASQMFGVPVEKHGANSELRQKGKIATLACGYGGGPGALKAMGATRMGLDETELRPIVDAWRGANPNIVNFWHALEKTTRRVIKTRHATRLGRLTIDYQQGALIITLPSGRALTYLGATIKPGKRGHPAIHHWGVNTARQWAMQETYGGKLAENVVQATARDLLAHAMRTLETAGYRIVMHIHDEVVIEASPGQTLTEAIQLMTDAPSWAEGLPLAADGYECDYYKKD